MTIIRTVSVSDPHNAALAFSAMLGADKGVSSEILESPHDHRFIVLADDGRAVEFKRV